MIAGPAEPQSESRSAIMKMKTAYLGLRPGGHGNNSQTAAQVQHGTVNAKLPVLVALCSLRSLRVLHSGARGMT